MLRWALVPALAFVLAFAGSLVHFAHDDEGRSGEAAAAPGDRLAPADRLVITYTPTVDDADHGYLGSLRLDGSDLENVMEPRGAGEASNVGSPSAAPDGRWVAFQRASAGSAGAGPPFVYVIPLDGSKPARRVTRGTAPEIDPAWSPDGRRIAFARRIHGQFDLFSARPDGSDAKQVTATPVDELSPAWSPDGERLAFTRYEDGVERGSGDLWTAHAEGGHERRLLGDEHDYAGAAWSPDGTRIALLKDSLVAVMPVRGGAPRPLTPVGDFKESRPAWSRDGKHLAFTRDPGKILTMDADGAHIRRVPFDRAANGVDWVPGR